MSNSDLLNAAKNGDTKHCIILLNNGADINTQEPATNFTPLCWAAYNGHTDTCITLINHGANVNINNHPLFLAANKGNKDICELLVNNNAKVNSSHRNGQTPLHSAAMNGHLQTCNFLLSCEAEVNIKNDDGDTPLHLAARYGHNEICALLLSEGAEVNSRNKDKNTPLLHSAFYGYETTCKTLLKHGAEVNAQNIHKTTPLMEAAANEKTNICKILLTHRAEVNAQNQYDQTPLHLAAQSNSTNNCKILIAHGADINLQNISGNNPLYGTIRFDQPDNTFLLISEGITITDPIREKIPEDLITEATSLYQLKLKTESLIIDDFNQKVGKTLKTTVKTDTLENIFSAIEHALNNNIISLNDIENLLKTLNLHLKDIKNEKKTVTGKFQNTLATKLIELNEQTISLRTSSITCRNLENIRPQNADDNSLLLTEDLMSVVAPFLTPSDINNVTQISTYKEYQKTTEKLREYQEELLYQIKQEIIVVSPQYKEDVILPISKRNTLPPRDRAQKTSTTQKLVPSQETTSFTQSTSPKINDSEEKQSIQL